MNDREIAEGLRAWYARQDWVHCSNVYGGHGACETCDRELRGVAAEIWRQMRWASYQSCNRHFGETADDHAFFNRGDWLTLAPEGWNP